ncbi:MAG TPA: branched-chain amino acid ABC transporter permease [Chthoniobacterales bacterium]
MNLFSWLPALNGPQTKGAGRPFWAGFALLIAAAYAFPFFSDDYTVGNVAYFFTWQFMTIGLCLIWGYGGALSFGQTAFFGISGYTYGVLTINFGSAYGLTLLALVVALLLSAVVAALLGYFLFFGRVSGVFLGIVTLAVSLVLERFMAQTAGPQWHIGEARLNGYNGMSSILPITLPWFGEDIALMPGTGFYLFVLTLLLAVYLGFRIIINSRFGNVLLAIRENPGRAEMLGYDVRKYQLGAFVAGGVLAGLSGVLYSSWGQYITPSSMSLTAAALPVIWVAMGGRSDISATVVGTFVVLAIFQTLTIYGSQYALVIMGALLLLNVLTTPEGLILQCFQWITRLTPRRRP